MGDVIKEGSNLYGDGVNIASRLETFSQFLLVFICASCVRSDSAVDEKTLPLVLSYASRWLAHFDFRVCRSNATPTF